MLQLEQLVLLLESKPFASLRMRLLQQPVDPHLISAIRGQRSGVLASSELHLGCSFVAFILSSRLGLCMQQFSPQMFCQGGKARRGEAKIRIEAHLSIFACLPLSRRSRHAAAARPCFLSALPATAARFPFWWLLLQLGNQVRVYPQQPAETRGAALGSIFVPGFSFLPLALLL